MSLRATPEAVAEEILDAWFAEALKPGEEQYVEQVRDIERKYAPHRNR